MPADAFEIVDNDEIGDFGVFSQFSGEAGEDGQFSEVSKISKDSAVSRACTVSRVIEASKVVKLVGKDCFLKDTFGSVDCTFENHFPSFPPNLMNVFTRCQKKI